MVQEKLEKLRKVYGYSKKDMAIFLDINEKTYRQKINGESPFLADEMFAISKLFKKPIEEIFLPRTYQFGKLCDKTQCLVYQTKKQSRKMIEKLVYQTKKQNETNEI